MSGESDFYPIYLSSTKTFTQNFILQPKIKSKFLHLELQKLVFKRRITRSFFELMKETNSFGHLSRVKVTKL